MTGPSCGRRQNAVAPVVSCFWNNTSEQCSARPIGQACQPCALSVCNACFGLKVGYQALHVLSREQLKIP